MIGHTAKNRTIVRKIEVLTLEIRDNISTANDGEFRELLAKFSDEGCCPFVILDLSRMRFINSSGLGAIANLSMKLRKLSGDLVIVSSNRELTQVFQQDNIAQTAHIVGGIVGAVFGFQLTRSPGRFFRRGEGV